MFGVWAGQFNCNLFYWEKANLVLRVTANILPTVVLWEAAIHDSLQSISLKILYDPNLFLYIFKMLTHLRWKSITAENKIQWGANSDHVCLVKIQLTKGRGNLFDVIQNLSNTIY